MSQAYRPSNLILQGRGEAFSMSWNHTGHPADLGMGGGHLERIDLVSGASSSLHECF